MKKWLVHKKGVIGVDVVAKLGENGFRVTENGGWLFDVSARDLRDTEAEARREHVDREACRLEELAERHESQRVDAEALAKGHMDDAKWNAEKAAEARARAKGLRDALDEVKDATEGRR